MPTNERRFWWCREGHIIGEIRRVSLGLESSHKVRALMVFERSVAKVEDVPEELPPLRMVVIGDARMIKCTVEGCDQCRDWNIGDDAMAQLLERYQIADQSQERK